VTMRRRSGARSGRAVADAGEDSRALKDGSELTALADGARGYADRPASDQELAVKFWPALPSRR